MTNRLLCFACIVGLVFTLGCAPDRQSEADRTADRQEETLDMGDAAITARVHGQLAADEGLSTLTDINVTTENGVVRLTGEVPNENMKQRVEAVTKRVDGVTRVQNDLKVTGEQHQ